MDDKPQEPTPSEPLLQPAATEPSSSTPPENSTPPVSAAPITPVFEPTPPPAPLPPSRKKRSFAALWVVSIVVFSAIAGAGGYMVGKAAEKPAPVAAVQQESTGEALEVPIGATQISKCAVGRGAQYAEPKDIPVGPIYNVWEGKVIGIEFMVGKDDLLTSNKSFLNLPLFKEKYDHVNIGLLSQGHAGFPSPHYHVDVMTAPTSVTDKITCKDQAATTTTTPQAAASTDHRHP